MNEILNQKTLEFDVFKTLHVIEDDPSLNEIFKDSVGDISYNMLRTMEKQGTLNIETKNLIEEFFNIIILNNQRPYEAYYRLTKSTPKEEKTEVNPQQAEIVNKQKKNKPPKYYGKLRILKDIQENNGNITELDRAMLSLNNLRNITAKLRNRGIKTKVKNINTLTEADCRDIIAAVRIVENKLNNILKKK